MTTVFLHPPFDAPDVLGSVLADGIGNSLAATIRGYAPVSDGGVRVALTPRRGAETVGRFAELDTAARERLDFAMAAIGAFAAPVDGDAVAYVFREVPAGAADMEAALSGEARQRLIEAISEAMDHFGSISPEEMPFVMHGIGIRALGRARGREARIARQLGSEFGGEDLMLQRHRRPYAHYFGMEEFLLQHRRFDGNMSATMERAVFTSGDAVTVLPYDVERDLVLLIEQFRAGPLARRDPRPWCLETVAGRCDRTEPPEETARREAEEEAGLRLGRLERVSAFYPSPGIMSEYIVSFVGEADLGSAGGTHGLDEEDEDIRSIIVPRERAMAAVASGEINCAPLLISLLWLEANASRLRTVWGS